MNKDFLGVDQDFLVSIFFLYKGKQPIVIGS